MRRHPRSRVTGAFPAQGRPFSGATASALPGRKALHRNVRSKAERVDHSVLIGASEVQLHADDAYNTAKVLPGERPEAPDKPKFAGSGHLVSHRLAALAVERDRRLSRIESADLREDRDHLDTGEQSVGAEDQRRPCFCISPPTASPWRDDSDLRTFLARLMQSLPLRRPSPRSTHRRCGD